MERAMRIECTLKQPEAPPQRQVRLVGGTDAEGRPWRMFQQDCIDAMWKGARFYILHDGEEVEVEVGWNGLNQYVRTSMHHCADNLLLALPDCT